MDETRKITEEQLDSLVDDTTNLEDAFQGLFKTSVSGTGEEELLRIASKFSIQLTAPQIKALTYLRWISKHPGMPQERKEQIQSFLQDYLEYKQYNGSDMFVMRALDSISLRKFIGENAFKIDIQK